MRRVPVDRDAASFRHAAVTRAGARPEEGGPPLPGGCSGQVDLVEGMPALDATTVPRGNHDSSSAHVMACSGCHGTDRHD
jgi:hypothetical protein